MGEHKTFQVRMQMKNDTAENWDKNSDFIPLSGEIIIYNDLDKIKIGDGITAISDLEFQPNGVGKYDSSSLHSLEDEDSIKLVEEFTGLKSSDYTISENLSDDKKSKTFILTKDNDTHKVILTKIDNIGFKMEQTDPDGRKYTANYYIGEIFNQLAGDAKNTASGFYSHAEGEATVASGFGSHAEGSDTNATNAWTHAEGWMTTASGMSSHAEGHSTEASGMASHAEGVYTVASGDESHAEGFNTIAAGTFQHVSGKFNISDSTSLEIIGNGMSKDKRSNARTLDANGNEVLAGKLTVGAGPTENMDVATKQYVDEHNLDPLIVTLTFTGMEENGDCPIFSGTADKTSDEIATAVSEGRAVYATAEAPEVGLTMTAPISLVSGAKCVFVGPLSNIESIYIEINEDNAVVATVYKTHTVNGLATGSFRSTSSAKEDDEYNLGVNAAAIGFGTKASGLASFSEGSNTTASGDYSHAEGLGATASGSCSHAEGYNTIASGKNQHVSGTYNISDDTALVIIGNGKGNVKGANNQVRSNAFSLATNGEGWFSGDVYVGSTSGTNKDEGSKKLATEDFVNSQLSHKSITYTGVKASANNADGATFYFCTVKPTSYNSDIWHVKYQVEGLMSGRTDGIYFGVVDFYGSYSANQTFSCWNNHYNTSYRCLYYHSIRPVTETGFKAGFGHALGLNLYNSYSPTSATYTRTFKVTLLEADNCEVSMFDELKLYSALEGTGSTNYAAIISRDAYNNGLRESGDDNSVDRTCLSSLQVTAKGTMYGGQLILSADGDTWFSINTKARAIATTNICTTQPFSRSKILYYSNTGTVSNGSKTAASALFSIIPFDLRYSSNKTSFTAHKPIYLKCTYDSSTDLYTLNSSEWITQTIPTTEDGFYYILLGYTYSTASVYFNNTCPVFKYTDGAFREVRPEVENTIASMLGGIENGTY